MQPLPIPTYGEAVEPFLIPHNPTIVHVGTYKSPILFNNIIHNHPPFLSTNMYEGTILHIHTQPYIQYIPRGAHPSLSQPWGNSGAIAYPQPKGSSGAIAHPPLWGRSAAIAHPQPRGKLWSHCPSPLTYCTILCS